MSQKEANFIYDKIKHIEHPVGVEVGVADGGTSIPLLQLHLGLHLYCVDPYEMYNAVYDDGKAKQHGYKHQEQFDRQYVSTYGKLQQYNDRCTFMRKSSDIAAFHFSEELFDFVFIDGNHLHDSVREDIKIWLPKVRPGGIMLGHDYNPGDANLKLNVVAAVNESFTQEEINKGSHSIWWVQK